MDQMSQRTKTFSLLVVVLIILIAVAMYAAFGNQGGFTGVPRLLPPDVGGGNASQDILDKVVWVLLIVVSFVVFGFVLYKLRRVTD